MPPPLQWMNCMWHHFFKAQLCAVVGCNHYPTIAEISVKQISFCNQFIINWKSQVYLYLLQWGCTSGPVFLILSIQLCEIKCCKHWFVRQTLPHDIIVNDSVFHSKILQFCCILHIMFDNQQHLVSNHMAAFKEINNLLSTCYLLPKSDI